MSIAAHKIEVFDDLLEGCRNALLLRNLTHKYEQLRQLDDDLRTDATEAAQDEIYREILEIEKHLKSTIDYAEG